MPSDGWYGPAIDNPSPKDGGTFVGPVTIGVLHTTESSRFVPNKSNYFGHSSYPHFTVDVVDGKFKCWQHISIRRAARALMNRSGGVQTNREGCVQIEIVGNAVRPITDEAEMVRGLAALMRWIESETDIPRSCSVEFLAYPASYGNSRVRLSNSAWTKYKGWLGHQHVPENSHGDPGAIDIKKLLALPPAKKPDLVVPEPVLEPEKKELVTMILVLDPQSNKQYICSATQKRHVKSQEERAILIDAGVPYFGDKVSEKGRNDLLGQLAEA